MYDLEDLQTLFESATTRDIVLGVLKDIPLEYEDRNTHIIVEKTLVITYLHNRIILLRESQPSVTLYSNNKKHVERLSELLASLNE